MPKRIFMVEVDVPESISDLEISTSLTTLLARFFVRRNVEHKINVSGGLVEDEKTKQPPLPGALVKGPWPGSKYT